MQVPGPQCPMDNPNCQCCLSLTCHHEDANPPRNKFGLFRRPPWVSKSFPNIIPPQLDFSDFMKNVGSFHQNLTQHAHHSSSLMTSSTCRSISPDNQACECQHLDQCNCKAQVQCSPFGYCQCCHHKQCHGFQGIDEPVPNWFPTKFFDNAGFPFSSDNFFGNEWNNFFV
eukprot:TCALIF_12200-PB protein Name:"Protein of unknown function" AED:0.26 eAED:0.26 QI:233/0.66/0.75/1/1/1/4/769/169